MMRYTNALDLLCRRDHGLAAEPVVEADLAERGTIGYECTLAQLRAEVTATQIWHDRTRIVKRRQVSAHELVQAKLLRPRHLDDAVHWWSERDPGDRCRDVLCRHRLNQHGCKSHGV